jgi:hypothetical protein
MNSTCSEDKVWTDNAIMKMLTDAIGKRIIQVLVLPGIRDPQVPHQRQKQEHCANDPYATPFLLITHKVGFYGEIAAFSI